MKTIEIKEVKNTASVWGNESVGTVKYILFGISDNGNPIARPIDDYSLDTACKGGEEGGIFITEEGTSECNIEVIFDTVRFNRIKNMDCRGVCFMSTFLSQIDVICDFRRAGVRVLDIPIKHILILIIRKIIPYNYIVRIDEYLHRKEEGRQSS